MAKESVTGRAFRMYSGFNPWYFPLVFLKIVFDSVSPYFNLWMSAEIVTALSEGRERRALYLLVAVTLLGNLAVRALVAVLDRSVGTARAVLEDCEEVAFYHKTLLLDYDKLEDPAVYRLRRKIDENGMINFYGMVFMKNQVEDLMNRGVNIAFSAALLVEMFARIAGVPFRLSALLLFAGLAGCVALSVFFRSRNGRIVSEFYKKIGDFMLMVDRVVRGHRASGMDARIYRQQMILDRIFEKSNRDHRDLFQACRDKDWSGKIPVILLTRVSELCAYLAICGYCAMGAFAVGGIIKYVGCLTRATEHIGAIVGIFSNLRHNEEFLKTYLEYFDIGNDMYQGSLAVEKRSDRRYDVEFRDVSFRYAGAEGFALKHISLRLAVGERLAVVGMNGSGKTTFIKLLCRLYDPTEGEVVMNDFNVRKYDYRQYLDLFSVVFQDYKLLAMPLGSNVACAAGWDGEKAQRLLEQVGFGERYREMPKGLETPLYKDFDEDGVEVSGGEAQKIALARALYRDAPFIILDEPTAALDPIAEAEIYEKFDEIVGDRTAIYISHRLSSCRFCDRIAVFHQGEIVQTGTHEELLADEKGKYYELWHAQAQYYS